MKRLTVVFLLFCNSFAYANVASKDYVDRVTVSGAELEAHISDTNNPHTVTKAQVGLGNVVNVDQTNANNLTSGTVGYGRLPVGTVVNTVAAGNDSRFDTIPTTAPSGAAPAGRAFIWVEP